MIIKCPECGHQVSDKAPVCPSCGVEIAGHIIRCSNCGELYLKEEPSCPNCHHTESHTKPSAMSGREHPAAYNDGEKRHGSVIVMSVHEDDMTEKEDNEKTLQQTTVGHPEDNSDEILEAFDEPETEEQAVDAEVVMDDNAAREVIANAEVEEDEDDGDEEDTPEKRNHMSLAVSLLIAVITGAVLLFLYNQGVGVSKANTEQDAYTQAIGSDEPTVLKNYLSENPKAPKAHRDSISKRLKTLATTEKNIQEANNDLTVAMASNSKATLQQFLAKYPDSKNRSEIEAKIDEIDWAQAVAKNDENAYLGYKAQHANGIHSKEADEKLKLFLVHTVTEGEKTRAVGAVRQLLQGINSKNTEKISGAVASSLNFLGAGGATVKDIRRYMTDKLYQADVKTINWHLGSPAEVTKDSNDAGTELHLKVPATLDIERQGGKSKRSYVISATIKDGRITRVNWNQI